MNLIKVKVSATRELYSYVYRSDESDVTTQKLFTESEAEQKIKNEDATILPYTGSYLDIQKKREETTS